ncbi:hypothetical protein FLM9_1147 [Candidatus Synechococcus spongiarum]|uniref:Uncharacterized protein n=1 Tax=Candidatus Synechococcus spongiarum TaxID=431041 RepID=A0A164Z5N8_9SYNE|nr:hypothetical protein FLM9_1147 [Candidatus Synechococcus spongiarum]
MKARCPPTEDGLPQGHGPLGSQPRLAVPCGAALIPLPVGGFLLGDSHRISGTRDHQPSILAMAWNHVKLLGMTIWLQLFREGNTLW